MASSLARGPPRNLRSVPTPTRRHARAPRLTVVAAVAVGGALGTVIRYELALAEPVASGRFPWTTFGVNVVGALLLGLVLGALSDPARATVARPFLAVGVCGGLTTFSTWMVESVLLTRDGHGASAAIYVVTSLVSGLVAVTVGVLGMRAALGSREPIVFDPAEDD